MTAVHKFSINRKSPSRSLDWNRLGEIARAHLRRNIGGTSTSQRGRQSLAPPPKSEEERRALEKLTVGLGSGEAPKRVLHTALDLAEKWRGKKRKARKARYQLLECVYEVHLRAYVSKPLQAAIDRECDRRKIRRTAASHPANVLVKLIIDPPAASVTQYALALRQATTERIRPNQLAQRLAAKGNGIDAMARRFSKMHPKKKRALQQREDADLSSSHAREIAVSLMWKSSALKTWVSDELPDGKKVRIIVRKISATRGRVLSARLAHRRVGTAESNVNATGEASEVKRSEVSRDSSDSYGWE
jgi:hypothetical protein